MFPSRAFAPRYFPARYFPGAAAGPSYATMTQALAAALAADATLAAAFVGGFSQGEADRDRKWPYGVFVRQEVKPVHQLIGRRNAVKRATFSFHCFSRSAFNAESLAELLKTRLLPNDGADGLTPFDPAPLAWTRGAEISRYQPGPASEGPESTGLSAPTGSGNKDVFESTVFVTWLVTTW